MVDRLNVIVVSRSGLGAKSEAMIEAVVGNLAGRAGIDLVLVSPLAEINDGSTDQLTLLSIGSGAAVLTWTSPEQTMSDLGRVGFKGLRSPHAGDPMTLPKQSMHVVQRKVYAIDLRDLSAVDDLVAQLDRLRTAESVKTFSIGRPSTASKGAEEPPGSKQPAPKGRDESPGTSPSPSTAPAKSRRAVDALASRHRPPSSLGDAGLDDLLDQLDEFDV